MLITILVLLLISNIVSIGFAMFYRHALDRTVALVWNEILLAPITHNEQREKALEIIRNNAMAIVDWADEKLRWPRKVRP
jgi:hypothetical protein